MAASLVVRGGTVVDGTGAPGRRADVVVDGDRIVHVGARDGATPAPGPDGHPAEVIDAEVIDATGLVVVPGFINVLSHAWISLQRHPTGASEALQGVTTEVFGEAFSPGPGGRDFARLIAGGYADAEDVVVDFPRLSEGLSHLESRGVGLNVASFIGGHNLRVLGAGFDDRPLERPELDRLRGIVDEEMADGALGIGTALIYPPGNFARTEELVALCEVVGSHDGLYISHLRSEGDQFIECLDELLHIGAAAPVRTEVYHLKAAGQANWPKMKVAIERIEESRGAGQPVAADMYPYTAGGTSLAACIPPAFHVGGPDALRRRLSEPKQRAAMVAQMAEPSDEFENLYLAAGGGGGILFLRDLADGTPTAGRRLSEAAADLGLEEVPALLELVARDPGIGAAYFIVDEDNLRLGLSQPWVSIGSDSAAFEAAPPFSDSAAHPRAYGSFARFLGRYGRDEGLFPLEEAVRRLTSLPADNLRLARRGRLEPGAYADIVVFDPETVSDPATFVDPHRYATGVRHVLVNGVPVVRDAALTRATPGRRLRRAA
ncbi:MAG TPA: D-aminoacylase [Acidimicrobiales bacterium]|nr:D-aminoacylase [Acidimicrobiales bacterium]